jgi:hypothetical protein
LPRIAQGFDSILAARSRIAERLSLVLLPGSRTGGPGLPRRRSLPGLLLALLALPPRASAAR